MSNHDTRTLRRGLVFCRHPVQNRPTRGPEWLHEYSSEPRTYSCGVAKLSATDTQAGANSLRSGPDGRGRFGIFGGRFVAETLMPLLLELDGAYRAAQADPEFRRELDYYLKDYVAVPAHCGSRAA